MTPGIKWILSLSSQRSSAGHQIAAGEPPPDAGRFGRARTQGWRARSRNDDSPLPVVTPALCIDDHVHAEEQSVCSNRTQPTGTK
ncbi:hypothetical protein GGTG_11456 [Gaeumannomyces tritici R3-111a-1]|uniref:Uncharacterized protein n=1 Tax=Gaeumannomyces tritici (strain R3-111a-1) TaxID=644352 RepID=J3PD87_GAET3|nr:hypothetical protein GGTG_11456 [Gaeumannomyces tritici R3-111a-1]EJT70432.1 hypothetical protein GGTG_11456 [Gaeumannomyces tritici R3-111a-1]